MKFKVYILFLIFCFNNHQGMGTSIYPPDDYTTLVDFSLANTNISKSDITYQVFSSGEKLGFHNETSIKQATFDRKLPTKFIVHGWMNSSEGSPYYKTLRAAYEQQGKYNIIYVDWSRASNNLYSIAAANSKIVGEYFGDFIIAAKFDLDKVHLIGHSLGSQVTGFAAKSIFNKIRRKILRVTALDAAGPKFEGASIDNRLEENDAQMVDAVHTDDHHYGYSTAFGRVDFFVNGGNDQPGCPSLVKDDNCSHARSIWYFLESLKTNTTAYLSESWNDYLKGNYEQNNTAIFGENLDLRTKGKFYFATKNDFLFQFPGLSIGRNHHLHEML